MHKRCIYIICKKYAFDMHKYAYNIYKYATNMQKICRYIRYA